MKSEGYGREAGVPCIYQGVLRNSTSSRLPNRVGVLPVQPPVWFLVIGKFVLQSNLMITINTTDFYYVVRAYGYIFQTLVAFLGRSKCIKLKLR